ncbi:MAG: CBS domain-containing protein [Saprospiraceae bacterium]|nr:CBS domain-containing protein [Saprospiraceae bacterium]
MSHHVVVAATHHKFSQVLEFFARFKVHHIPVTDDDSVIGIISAKDVIKHLYRHLETHEWCTSLAQLDEDVPIETLMTPDPMTIGPGEPVERAAQLFKSHSFHSLPVIQDGKIRGIITTKDIAKHVILSH